jgi:hypothetical protein
MDMRLKAFLGLALILLGLAGCGGGARTPVGGTGPGKSPPEYGANVARIPGLSATDVAAAAVLASYPPSRGTPPNGWVLVTPNDWQEAILAAQFAAKPVQAGLLLTNQAFLPTPSQDVMGRLGSASFPRSGGIQALLFRNFGRDVLLYLTRLKLRVAQILAPDIESLDLKLVPYRGGFSHQYSSDVVVVSAQARDYALPAGAWSAYSGDTVAFVNRDSVPQATQALLSQRQKLLAAKPAIYILGPTSVISSAVESQLGAFGTVKRIAGPTAIDTAVAFARYRDPSTGFGWGLTKGPVSVSLVNTSDWGNAAAAYNLAGTGPQAPLLLTSGSGPLPSAVVEYLQSLRSSSPGQGYVFGSSTSVSSSTLHQLDALLAAG